MIRRYRYILTGQVQGVGLRYLARRTAHSLELSGWVRNLPDGSVELELEGEEFLLGEALERIGRGSFVEIEDVRSESLAPLGESGFRVL